MQRGVHWGLEGHLKAGNATITSSPLPHFRIARSKFDVVKIRTVKFLQFLFSNLKALYKIFENLPHSKISRYTVLSACACIPTGRKCVPINETA